MRNYTPLLILAVCMVSCSKPVATSAPPPPLAKADSLASKGDVKTAVAAYDQYIEGHKSDSDRTVQDQVAGARIKKGFAQAKGKDFPAARTSMLEAAKEYKGTGKMTPLDGGAKDQATYQAAVCLLAMGKRDEAKTELIRFISDYPDSPQVNGAHKRLLKLCNKQELAQVEAQIDHTNEVRTNKLLIEQAKCGPRAITYLAHLLSKNVPAEADLIKVCGTSSTGTNMDGMVRGLKLCGLDGYGYALNRQDFGKMPTPALLLSQDHFFVVLGVGSDSARLYDPVKGLETQMPLPSDDPSFSVNVLTLSKLSAG